METIRHIIGQIIGRLVLGFFGAAFGLFAVGTAKYAVAYSEFEYTPLALIYLTMMCVLLKGALFPWTEPE